VKGEIMKNDIELNNSLFENLKHMDEKGLEYWYARELQKIFDYSQWRRFEETINRAMTTCINSKYNVYDHFANVGKTITMPKGASKIIKDYKLSRYACYLIAQNGDSRKKVIALAQTYFAIQTRRQELSEKDYSLLTEDEKRLYQRSLTKKGNTNNFLINK